MLPQHVARTAVTSLARAHTIIVKSGGKAGGRQRVTGVRNPTATINRVRCITRCICGTYSPRERVRVGFHQGKAASLSGVAQPGLWQSLTTRLGAELVYSKRFADHHRFTQQRVLKRHQSRQKKRQAEVIITRRKMHQLRFPKLDRRDLPVLFMHRRDRHRERRGRDLRDCVRKSVSASWILLLLSRTLE